MAGDFSSEAEYPVYATKKAMLRGIAAEILPNCPNGMALLFQINNTDLDGLADKSTVFEPAQFFDASE